MKRLMLLLWANILFVAYTTRAQSVGLVLSGGGVRGMAHLGVIRALEEERIPIDYIAGTSSGALVGSLYAIGLTPRQIENILTNPSTVNWVSGKYDEENAFYFLKKPDDASWVSFRFRLDSVLRTQLPSNVVNPQEIDFELMQRMAAPIAIAHYDFDSLVVPFRCVAANITTKSMVVFSEGDLARAVRSSMAFPFYFSPVIIGDNILVDGGVYNNFPADILLKEFNPDILIGVNTAGPPELPAENNFLSQLKTMITQPTDYRLPRTSDLMIEPDISGLGTFEFESAQTAIDSGYNMAMRMMPLIRQRISRQADSTVISRKRNSLLGRPELITVDQIKVRGVNTDQAGYIRSVLNPSNQCLSLEQLRRKWFNLTADDNFSYLFPTLTFNTRTGDYDLYVEAKRKPGLAVDFGGVISSKPVNTGFISLQQNFLGHQSLSIRGNLYFGKLYNSAQVGMRLDVPGRLPFFIEPMATINQFDYFRSSTAFNNDIKPSFLVQNDRSYGLNLGIPVRNKGRVAGGILSFRNRDRYYLTRNFSVNDTADITTLEGYNMQLVFERNTLNRKMYADEGNYFEIRSRYTYASESTLPGSTSPAGDTILRKHDWFQIRLRYDLYFKTSSWYTAGMLLEMNLSSMPFLSNYISTKSVAPAFSPIPELQTIFQEQYRAINFTGLGIRNIFRLNEDFSIRIEGYLFQPFQEILSRQNFKAYNGEAFNSRYVTGMFNLLYGSPVGPVSLALNYIGGREEPLSVMLHIGYFLFNRRALN